MYGRLVPVLLNTCVLLLLLLVVIMFLPAGRCGRLRSSICGWLVQVI
jgi:hypothetical protein